jgi:hypothetical protein
MKFKRALQNDSVIQNELNVKVRAALMPTHNARKAYRTTSY